MYKYHLLIHFDSANDFWKYFEHKPEFYTFKSIKFNKLFSIELISIFCSTNATGSSHNTSSNSTINQQEQQQQQQSRLSVQNTQHKPMPSLMDMASYGLIDDLNTIHSLDSMDLLSTSPPKQQSQTGKAPSIFSPEWNEKSSSVTSNNGNNSLLSGIDRSANGSDMMNAMPSLSPKREYDKRAISDISVKKEKQKEHSQSHRTSSSSSSSIMQSTAEKSSFNIKREQPLSTSAGMQYDASLPQNLLDSKPAKRSHNSDMGQMDSTDYQPRELKMRRTEQLSPIQNVSELAKSATSSKSSFASLNGIESKPMESPNSDKYGKLGEYAKGSGNAVPITTDLVSSLLKESLNDTVSKYGTSLDMPQKKTAPPSAIKSEHNVMAGYNMPQHSMMEAREQSQTHLTKTEEFDRLQSSQYGNQQHSQYRMDSKRMQIPTVPTSRSTSQQMPASKATVGAAADEQQYTEQSQQHQQQQLQQKPPQFHQEQSHQNMCGSQTSLPPQLQIKTESDQRTKSEKKKKKEKHKNKDKEKSKNREERKKHKKDKDRHKEKSKSHSSGHEPTSSQDAPKSPIRLKFSITDHHASSSGEGASFNSQTSAHNDVSASVVHQQQNEIPKLKIARIKAETNTGVGVGVGMNIGATGSGGIGVGNGSIGGGSGVSNVGVGSGGRSSIGGNEIKSQTAPQAPGLTSTSSLKIKIPKDKLENYSCGVTNMYNNQHMHSNELNHPQNSGSGSGTSKKKDRNRDRDKSMRNSTNLSNQTKVIV